MIDPRLATFNILHGRTVGDVVDPARLRDRIRRLIEQERSGRADLTAVAVEAGPLTVAKTHLSFVPGWNRHRLRRSG